MIYFLKGILETLNPGYCILDVGGVGYYVRIPLSVFEDLASQVHSEVKLYTFHRLRENAQDLFGFTTEENRKLFILITELNGIGPSIALNILSHMNGVDFLNTIRSQDEKSLNRIPGIGPSKAKKILFEMNSKLKKMEKIVGENKGASPFIIQPESGIKAEAVMALTESLGFELNKSIKIVEKILLIDSEISLEDLIRQALNEL